MGHKRSVVFTATDLGRAIRAERKARHLTQGWVAERVGIRRATVADLESGKNSSIYTLLAVLSALDKGLALQSTRPEIDRISELLDDED